MLHSNVRALASLLIVFAIAPFMPAQEETYTADELQRFFDSEAKLYEFTPKELNLIEKPILHWSNPVRRQEQGGLYVWTLDGRPAVMASIFSFEVRSGVWYRHEIFSLTDFPMKAELDGRVVWQPKANPGDLWRDLEGVPAVGGTVPRRLVQMRGIARQFSGEKTELDGKLVKLKLMPQPLFRYSSEKQGVIDGAVFGIVEATDPEMYLFIEAYGAKDQSKWRYAIMQSHWLDMKVYKGKEVVWTNTLDRTLMNTREGQMPYAAEPYFTFYARSTSPPPPEELRKDEKSTSK